MVTIKDIAREANVSPSTVSRVLSGNAKISKETIDKVMEVVERLGYIPNASAKSLVKKKAFAIGIFMPRKVEQVLTGTFFDQVVSGICSVINETEYDLVLNISPPENEKKSLENLIKSRKVDGIILLSSRVNDYSIEYLKKLKFPFIVIGTPYKNKESINWVDNDNKKASFDATNYLINLGHTQIGFLGGFENLVVTQDRLEGYKQALTKNNIEFDSDMVKFTELEEKSSYEKARELLMLKNRPTAIVCMDDTISFATIGAARELGLKIGYDISIIGFNNSIFTTLSYPKLTTIDINVFYLGKYAAELLLKELVEPHKTYKRLLVEHKLIEGDTCRAI
ncbi:LacI family DNA-binding transcriptional regulator [Caldicellulosiruptoraceae bacterium PP1]